MTSKRKREHQLALKAKREEKAARTDSTSRSIIEANKAAHDAKTARLKQQREEREAREAAEAGLKKGKR